MAHGKDCQENNSEAQTKTPSFKDRTYMHFCLSSECHKRAVPGETNDRVFIGIRKDVSKRTIDCPDCGSALYSKRIKPIQFKPSLEDSPV